jgi:hypothetical protein
VVQVEDTDLARSTRESEEAMIRDLKWLGLDWDEGPDKEGDCGPYRQSERGAIYKCALHFNSLSRNNILAVLQPEKPLLGCSRAQWGMTGR